MLCRIFLSAAWLLFFYIISHLLLPGLLKGTLCKYTIRSSQTPDRKRYSGCRFFRPGAFSGAFLLRLRMGNREKVPAIPDGLPDIQPIRSRFSHHDTEHQCSERDIEKYRGVIPVFPLRFFSPYQKQSGSREQEGFFASSGSLFSISAIFSGLVIGFSSL